MPGVGIEPTSLSRHDFKSCAYTSSATRAGRRDKRLEVWAGIEPAYSGFADRRVNQLRHQTVLSFQANYSKLTLVQ